MSDLLRHLRNMSEQDRQLLYYRLQQSTDQSAMPVKQRLRAFITTLSNADTEQLKAKIGKLLPDYMIPGSITQLREFPKLPNGKIDRAALSKLQNPDVNISNSIPERPPTETEQELRSIWKELLNREDIGLADNFFEVGGDSLLSIQFIAQAREKGMSLAPNHLFDYQTIESLAGFLDQRENVEERWEYIVGLRKKGTKAPLFCIHAGGGHVFFYNKLVDHLNPERPVYAIQPSGLYGDHPVHSNIEEMAGDYVKAIRQIQPTGPYNVMVYCFSASVGHEISRQMKQEGLRCNLIVVDTMVGVMNLKSWDWYKARILSFVKRFFGSPIKTLRFMVEDRYWYIRPTLINWFGTEDQKALEKVRTNLVRVCRDYPWPHYDGNISLILTKRPHQLLTEKVLESWQQIIDGEVIVRYTKGNHRTLFEKSDLPFVAEKIEESMMEFSE